VPRSSRTLTRLTVLACLTVAGVVLAACGSGDDRPVSAGQLAGVVRDPAVRVADVTLPDIDGTPRSLRADRGELRLVYFGYTSCPDVCPTTMSDIKVALGDLPEDQARRVSVTMVTVDPERDTPEVLTDYLDHFFDRFTALRTEDPGELRAAAKAFGVQYEVEEHEPGASYEVAHSALTYVVDDTGTVVVEWPFGFESTDMANDLQYLLTKETP
jgi:protein SCO1/2